MTSWKRLLGAACAALLALPATADNEEKEAKPAGATIKGTVKVEGRPPRRKKIRMTADPKCAAMHARPPEANDIVVDDDGHVQWAFVYVKEGVKGDFETPKEPAVIDQQGCQYHPHVLGVMPNQPILIKNSDDLLHNIHALPFSNREFNFGQPQKGMQETKTFANPEIMIKVKCDVHPWMGAWVGVVAHPFHAVTDEKGAFEIKGLPAGKYTLVVWHEKYKDVTAEVEVGADGAKTVDFVLKDRKGR